jgi:mRNA-degrading endonuclease RelE of RelBE toxin-antitoxin system
MPLIKIYESISYKKELKKLNKRYRSIDKDIKPLIQQLEAGETPGDRIAENKYPTYKVRVPNSDTRKGKSGGYRVIYYTITPESIWDDVYKGVFADKWAGKRRNPYSSRIKLY